MPLPQFKVTKKKDGREVTWFRDTQGRVRTSATAQNNWTRVEQVRDLADYGILLQLEQARQGLGSDGSPMPPLKSGQRKFVSRRDGVAQFASKKIRDLYGPGASGSGPWATGHMLDAIRVNYVDEKRATIAITTQAAKGKALANEQKAPWWGWSPVSFKKLQERSAAIFGTGVAERLFELGLIGSSALAFATNKLRSATSVFRRAA